MRVSDLLTKEDVQRFSKRSDWAAFRVVAVTWLSIIAVFAATLYWNHPVMWVIAVILLGSRQLALEVVIHDCGHHSMFTRRSWNSFVANWLAGPFVLVDANSYSEGHKQHHRLGGTKEDPDLQNYVNYAVPKDSFMRKIARDLSGITGIKIFLYSIKTYGPAFFVKTIIANACMAGVLILAGNGWLYWLWPIAWMTSHMLVIRIRQAAEHASVPDLFDPDPRKHTRTTIPSWWERILLAPNHVNYHLEHHILASVPSYRLREFHEFLKEKGHLESAEICYGYWSVIRKLILPTNKDTTPTPAST